MALGLFRGEALGLPGAQGVREACATKT